MQAVNADPRPFVLRVVTFPNLYLWLVFFASLDIIMTRLILFFRGTEINPIANVVIEAFGVPGMSFFKFGIVVFVICVCEFVCRIRPRTAKLLAVFSVVVTAFPVAWSMVLVLSLTMADKLPPVETEPDPQKRLVVLYPSPCEYMSRDSCRFAIGESMEEPWWEATDASELSFSAAASADRISHAS